MVCIEVHGGGEGELSVIHSTQTKIQGENIHNTIRAVLEEFKSNCRTSGFVNKQSMREKGKMLKRWLDDRA